MAERKYTIKVTETSEAASPFRHTLVRLEFEPDLAGGVNTITVQVRGTGQPAVEKAIVLALSQLNGELVTWKGTNPRSKT